MTERKTVLCLASYEKGHDFLRQCHAQGWRVLLLASHSLKDEVQWPTEAIDEIFWMRDDDKKWDPQETLRAVSYLARTTEIDRIVPMDDFDLEIAALLREHLRVPGMGETTTRYFRDKLAMRVRAQTAGLRVPEFVSVINDARVRAFTARVPGPWMLKPRFLAGAIGIRKVENEKDLWHRIAQLGDERSMYVLERFLPGDVFHVDSLSFNSEVRFSIASGYGKPPFDASHGGDVFTTRILPRNEALALSLVADCKKVLGAMKLVRGASHTEFIRSNADGQLYFLETAARCGGAHIADMLEAGTGLSTWREWAKIEIAGEDGTYEVRPTREDYAGLLIALAREEHPDTRGFSDPEVVWRMDKPHHIGLVVRSPSPQRIEVLINDYRERIRRDVLAFVPPTPRSGD